MQPETRYAKSGDVHIAYQVFGEGPINLVIAPFFVSNVEHFWDEPDASRWLLRVGSFARVVMFDKRGTGMSDRVAEMPGLDLRMDDLRAVMDAAGMEQAAILGLSEGGSLAALFAASYPNRCRALILYGALHAFRRGSLPRRRLHSFLATLTRHGVPGAPCHFSYPLERAIRPSNDGLPVSNGSARVRPALLHICA
jgi:pimeloyl-ACP methyl ester carboxylesterase